MSKQIEGTDDLPGDSIPPEAAGSVSRDISGELSSLVVQLDESLRKMNKSLDEAERARVALLSLSNAIEKVFNLVYPIIEGYIKKSGSESPSGDPRKESLNNLLSHPSIRSGLETGLMGFSNLIRTYLGK